MQEQFRAFPRDGAPWRIDFLGAISAQGELGVQPSIEVFLSKLARDSDDALRNGQLVYPREEKVVRVNVDQISLLKMGSVWINGIRTRSRPREVRKMRLTHADFGLMRFDSAVSIDGHPRALMKDSRYRIGKRARLDCAGAWMAVAINPTPEFECLVIPCTAIFQACAASSSSAVRKLIRGQLDKILDPKSQLLSDDPKTFHAELFHDINDSDAAPAASLMVDPIGMQEYRRLWSSLVADIVNSTRPGHENFSSKAHMKFGLPFKNEVHLKMLGKSIAFDHPTGVADPKWGFLVTEIVSIRTKFVFDRIVIERKTGPIRKEGDKDSDDPFRPRTKTNVPPGDPTQPLSSTVEPSSDFETLELTADGFVVAVGLETIKERSEVEKFKKRPRRPPAPGSYSGVAATGEVVDRQTGAAQATVNGQPVPSLPNELDVFLQVLEKLARSGIKLNTIGLFPNSEPHRAQRVSRFPRHIQGCRSWHWKEDGSAPRGFVLATVRYRERTHYLLELEKKTSAFALLHFYAHGGHAIEQADLERFLRDVARQNGWGAQSLYEHWRFSRIVHPSVDLHAGLARKITRSIGWIQGSEKAVTPNTM